MYCCAGSSVSIELNVRVISVIGGGRGQFLSPNAFCGVIQNNRKTAGLIHFQSSVLCDLQVKCIHCMKIWSY